MLTLLHAGGNRALATAIGRDLKGKLSPLLYCLGIGLSFANRWLGLAAYVVVALIWLVPDRRVERLVDLQPDENTLNGFIRQCGAPPNRPVRACVTGVP